MESLELRRLHSDLILTYKILFGLTSITAFDFFSFPNPTHNTRGHAYKLFENHCRINIRQHFFAERVIKPWNSLHVAPGDFKCNNYFERCLRTNDFIKFLVFTMFKMLNIYINIDFNDFFHISGNVNTRGHRF